MANQAPFIYDIEYSELRYCLAPFNTRGNVEYLADEQIFADLVSLDPDRREALSIGRKILEFPEEVLGPAISDIIDRHFPGGDAEACAWFKDFLDKLEEEMKKRNILPE